MIFGKTGHTEIICHVTHKTELEKRISATLRRDTTHNRECNLNFGILSTYFDIYLTFIILTNFLLDNTISGVLVIVFLILAFTFMSVTPNNKSNSLQSI